MKRSLRVQLQLESDDDELPVGEELDCSLDVRVELSTNSLRAELAAINYHLTHIACLGCSAERVSVSLWSFLSLLLKAEASELPVHQRVGVLGRQAMVYAILGRKRQAVRAARGAVRLMVAAHRADPAACRLPPFAPSFTRAVAVLGEWDQAESSGELVKGGLQVLHTIGRLWPSMARVVDDLQHHLRLSTDAQLDAVKRRLSASKRLLEVRVLATGVQEKAAAGELTEAAAEFVRHSAELRRLQVKRGQLRLEVEEGGGMEDEEGVEVRRVGREGQGGRGAAAGWSVDSVGALFSRSLNLEEDPLRTQTLNTRALQITGEV